MVVVIRKGICKCNLGILIGSKLTEPYVLLFECLMERLDVPVLFWRILPDEFVLADAKNIYRLSEVVARILVAVVRAYPQPWAVGFFCSDCICD